MHAASRCMVTVCLVSRDVYLRQGSTRKEKKMGYPE
jgi:hypothetical protein